MGKIKTISIKKSMSIIFLITVFIICLLSAVTIYAASRIQQNLLQQRAIVVSSYDYDLKTDSATGGYIVDTDNCDFHWQPLSGGKKAAFYACYAAMTVLPVIYIIIGIGTAAAVYYRLKLRKPILELQNGMNRIQDNDLDFTIEYTGSDELGQLCSSMEKLRKELRKSSRELWESAEQQKLINSMTSHDLRTPVTVLKGYLDYLNKASSNESLTEESLLDTITSMQYAVSRLEGYVDCVRDIEKAESITITPENQNTAELLKEIKSSIKQLEDNKNIVFSDNILSASINIDSNILFRITENLIQNAVRYAQKEIKTDIFTEEDMLIITVSDDGCGFTQEDLTQAATLFYSSEKGHDHFGIGLSICRLLCKKHGGTLIISNNENGGALVTAKIKLF